ncbi:hypothetical protein ACV07N_01240 [Roseivirga echinicomitans]
MRAKKIHTYNKKKAWYTHEGRMWHVEEGGNKFSFKNIEKMLKAYPDFASVPAIQASVDRHIEKAKEKKLQQRQIEVAKSKTEDPTPNQIEKSVTCYYCHGSGKTGMGMPCPNCRGKGKYLVTARGF